MEFITSEHLEKYEQILQKIDNENQLCEELEKQIKREDDKIIAANIALYEEAIRNKLFRVNVRVFDSVFELFDFCNSVVNIIDSLQNYKNVKFYLVEVYVNTLFQDKLANQKWLLNVRIRSTKKITSQSLNLKSEAFTYPLIVVLPFDTSERNSIVETSLALPSKYGWTTIMLEQIDTNISHHFKISNEKSRFLTSKSVDVVNVCKCYQKDVKFLQSLNIYNIRESTFSHNNSIGDFLKFLIRNSCHRVDVDMFSAIQKSKQLNLEVKTDSSGDNMITIYLNEDENLLKIKANSRLLYEVKKYFIAGINEKQLSSKKNTLMAFTVRKRNIPCEAYFYIYTCFFLGCAFSESKSFR